MPQITQTNFFDITPLKFLEACSANELREIDLLIQSRRFVDKMKGFEEGTVIADNPKSLATPTSWQCVQCRKVFRKGNINERLCQACLDKR